MAVPAGKFKVVFLGNVCVGKTSLVTRIMYDTFDCNYKSTVGIDFLCKKIRLGKNIVKLQIWDTAGQERFRGLLTGYIRDSAVAIVCFDVTSPQSFANVDKWVNDVRAQRLDKAFLIIVGNKIDKIKKRKVEYTDALAKAEMFNAIYLEVSAKTRDNIAGLYELIVDNLPPISDEEKGTKIKNKETHTKKQNCSC